MTSNELELPHGIALDVVVNGKKTTLSTEIVQRTGDFLLLTPIYIEGKLLGFSNACNISMLYAEKGKLFCWNNIEIKNVKHEKNIYYAVKLDGDAEVLNRRGSFRVFMGDKTKLTFFSAKGPQKCEVTLKDISESGLAFLSENEFDVGRIVRITMQAGEHTEMPVTAQIVRTQKFENRRDTLYGCKLVEKSPKLTNFLMRIQQEKVRSK